MKEGCIPNRIVLGVFLGLACLAPVWGQQALSTVSLVERHVRYRDYLDQYSNAPEPDATVTVDGSALVSSSDQVVVVNGYEGRSVPVVVTNESGFAEWQVSVPQEGLYNLSIEYFPVPGRSSAIERAVYVNGEIPYSEARRVVLPRIWVDDGAILRDDRGNDIRPPQEEAPRWVTTAARDSIGYYSEPLRFYLQSGRNTIRFESVREPVAIGRLTVHQISPAAPYGGGARVGLAQAETVTIEAETPASKSDPTLYAIFDRSSPATTPYHPSKLRLNTIGGEKWDQPGQWVEWEFSVPADGFYRVVFRARQNILGGSYSSRRILIDGEVPYSEYTAVRFPYSTQWQVLEATTSGGDPIPVYLEAGSHTMRMEATLGDMAPILRDVERTLFILNDVYRQVLMITGPTPDTYRDYLLERQIPDAIEELGVQAQMLSRLSAQLLDTTGERGAHVALLDRLAFQLQDMYEDPSTIPLRFDAFKGNVGALGTWILTSRQQPLELDTISIVGANGREPRSRAGVIARVWHSIRSFVGSFSEDYSSIGTVTSDNDAVRVWVGAGLTGGRDQAQVLKLMIDNSFTPVSGVDVNLQLISFGALLPATLAGRGPDIALQVNGSDPVNYAVRKAVVDLSQFPDYPQIEARFQESAVLPYRFNGGVYALPETQSFPMLFYRTDILQELELTPPQTWDDVFELLPVIQKRNMNFGLPINLPTNPQLGMTAFATFLYQYGGQFYTQDGSETLLDSEVAVRAFRDWTMLYANYKLPLQYDFANRFRIGELPIGIADYATYNLLSVFAPEIRDLWSFAPIPGTRQADGTIDRAAPGYGAGAIMLTGTENREGAWEFLKWWTSADSQVQFGRELEAIMGAAARYPTANIEALYRIPWSTSDFESLLAQWEWVRGVPEVPGGYFTPRHLDFAFKSVVYHGEESRQTLLDYVRVINEEIDSKRREFGLPLAED